MGNAFDQPTELEWPVETRRLLDEVVRTAGTILFLGAPDTGKSTLARWLVCHGVSRGRSVAFVDADVGQSDVGPPGTIGLALPEAPVPLSGTLAAERLYFIGDKSPAGHLLPTVLGTSYLVRLARSRRRELIVVNTTGLIAGIVGQTLKFHKIQAVRPHIVVALQLDRELEPLLQPFDGPRGPVVARLPVAPGTRTKSIPERCANREKALEAYFSDAATQVLDRTRVALWPPTPPEALPTLRGRLCGLLDGRGETLAVGILCEADAYSLTVVTPLTDTRWITAVQVGELRLAAAAEESAP